jgi:hypothetical protein
MTMLGSKRAIRMAVSLIGSDRQAACFLGPPGTTAANMKRYATLGSVADQNLTDGPIKVPVLLVVTPSELQLFPVTFSRPVSTAPLLVVKRGTFTLKWRVSRVTVAVHLCLGDVAIELEGKHFAVGPNSKTLPVLVRAAELQN